MQHLIASLLDSNADKRIAKIIAMASSLEQTLLPRIDFPQALSFPSFPFEHLTPPSNYTRNFPLICNIMMML